VSRGVPPKPQAASRRLPYDDGRAVDDHGPMATAIGLGHHKTTGDGSE